MADSLADLAVRPFSVGTLAEAPNLVQDNTVAPNIRFGSEAAQTDCILHDWVPKPKPAQSDTSGLV